jgi:hypothetical protein
MSLELRFTKNVEKNGNNKFVRLNSDKFNKNPHKEIIRYMLF